jgi:Zn-dependent peptidase ImmA (M78 family)
MTAAIQTRQRHAKARLWESLCPYDLAERMGIEVQFHTVPSLEALYFKIDPPLIMVGTQRPAGRRAYNAAHEIGHHVFGHGTTVHQLRSEQDTTPATNPKEFLADVFASFLLMPKLAVSKAFADRSLNPATITPEDVYRMACYFGVGYTTIIFHLQHNLVMITDEQADTLHGSTPKQLRAALTDQPSTELLVIDEQWVGRPADIRVNDLLLLPHDANVEGEALTTMTSAHGLTARAVAPGLARLTNSNASWSLFARVSRHEYVGRSIFRHDPEEP